MIDRSWEWARSHSRLRTNPIHQEEEINIVLTETFELEDSYIEEVNRGGTFHVQARFYKLMGEFKINSFKPNLYKLYTDYFSPALHRMITALSWRVRCLPVTELALHLHLGMLRGWVLLPMSWASSHLFVRFLVLTCFKSMYDVKLQENLYIYISKSSWHCRGWHFLQWHNMLHHWQCYHNLWKCWAANWTRPILNWTGWFSFELNPICYGLVVFQVFYADSIDTPWLCRIDLVGSRQLQLTRCQLAHISFDFDMVGTWS